MKKFFEQISRYAAGAATWATLHCYMSNNKHTELLENKKIMENLKNSVEILRKSSEEMQEILNQENIENFTRISGDLNTLSNQDINNNLVAPDHLTKNGLEEGKKILDDIMNIFSNIKDSGSSSNYILNIINQYYDFLNTLTVVQKGALGHLLAAIFILLCFTSILTIFYGETLIKYFEIEKRFTKIARFIEIRRKFQQYYFALNTCLILSTLFLIIYVNSVVLFF